VNQPRRVTVVSGKGGTGKTVVAASLASLAGSAVVADCDVDAANLQLLLHPEIRERHSFSGGAVAFRDPEKCTECGQCRQVCRFDAVGVGFDINSIACEGCGFCAHACPAGAIEMRPSLNGEWFVSTTRYGPMVHAELGPAEENSGKLVTLVRKRAREIAEEIGVDYVIADGPPGIGCPAIASLTGADLALVVTEPTASGIHDLERIVGVAGRLGVPVCCLVNKHDVNPGNTVAIEDWCTEHGVASVGRIPYDMAVVQAVAAGEIVVEAGTGPAAQEIERAWQRTTGLLADRA
jgi:MinD superfamily P-loop ATPase